MRKYHTLTVASLDSETRDSLRVALNVPENLREVFVFKPGQHLPIQLSIDGKLVRRTYSICSVPGEMPLVFGIRVQPGGKFSQFIQGNLKIGDNLEAMPPLGRFHADLVPQKATVRIAFAAGSGITPILSIMRTTLENEPESKFVLFYGNRMQSTTMFIDDLHALKNRFPARLQLYFLFSQEDQELEIFSGRLDKLKVTQLYKGFCKKMVPDEVYICGPGTMLNGVKQALVSENIDESVFLIERYGAPVNRKTQQLTPKAPANKKGSLVEVIMDGHKKSFEMAADGPDNLVDAAAVEGIVLPFSCRGGVCATCRTYVRSGEVRMATNHGLEPWEVEKGFVLACQARPLSSKITIDYDET